MSVAEKIKGAFRSLSSPALKTYSSFEEALASAGSGYEDSELVEIITLKTKLNRHRLTEEPSFGNSSLSTLTAILYICQQYDLINVIDLGGGTGLQYHMIRPWVNEKTKINWCVVESKALTAKCQPLFSTEELSFSDNLEKTIGKKDQIHLIFCSGVIQYLPKPYETLNVIARSNSTYLLFSRMCFSRQNNDLIILQKSQLSENGFGPMPPGFKDREIYYPQTSVQKDKFFNILSSKYKILFTFNDDSGVHHHQFQEGLGAFMKKRE